MRPLACLIPLALALTLTSGVAETEVYDFARGALGKGSPWSGDGAQLRLSPGEAGRLDFKLPALPLHRFLMISAQVEIASPFFRVNETGVESKDRLLIQTGDGRTLLDSSFSSTELGQSYPDRFGSFLHEPGTGAADDNSYTIDLLLPHTADVLELQIRWQEAEVVANNAGVAIQINGFNIDGGGSAYSITGLKISALESPTEIDEARATALLETISAGDPVAAHAALNELVRAGGSVAPFIRQRFDVEPKPDLEAKIAALTAGLRSDEFKERSSAEAALGELGNDALPHITALLADREALSADVRSGLEVVKTRLEISAEASPDQILANRVRTVLALLDSEPARAVEKLLPPVRKVELYEAPKEGENGAPKIRGGQLKFDFNGGDE